MAGKNVGIDIGSAFANARAEWNERCGGYVSSARTWRFFGLLAVSLAFVEGLSLVWISSQSSVVPFVVAVDKVGAVAAIDRLAPAGKPDRAVITAMLSRWIQSIRSVYVDASAQRALITEAYTFVNGRSAASMMLNEYMQANNPFERAKNETVSVQVETVLPIGTSGDTYRIDWHEERRDRGGNLVSSTPYQATVSLVVSPPHDEATIRVNPFGLFISSINWVQRL